MPRTGTHAAAKMEKAFREFEDVVNKYDLTDFSQFKKTKLKDVAAAAEAIDGEMARRKERRSVQGVALLLGTFESYEGVMDVLAPAVPYLPLIWAPIKLCLEFTSNHADSYEKLTAAYHKIYQNLPRFDDLPEDFIKQERFQDLLGDLYSTIVEFHKRAYRFIRRRCFIKRVFDASWKRFDFQDILECLGTQADLIDKQANVEAIARAEKHRIKLFNDAQEKSRARKNDEILAVLEVLDVKEYVQRNKVEELKGKRHEGTADWFRQHEEVQNWIGSRHGSLFWVNGKPGSGKSVLCSHLIECMQEQWQGTFMFFMCEYRLRSEHNCSAFLRHITAQLIRQNEDLVCSVYDKFSSGGHVPANKDLLELLPDLLSSITSLRLVVDGLDECEASEQKAIFSAISELVVKPLKDHSDANFKAAIFSQDTKDLGKLLNKNPKISLDEIDDVRLSISKVIHYEIGELRKNLDEDIPAKIYLGIERKLVDKANGMFLWVRLVIDALKDAENIRQLQQTVEELPRDINEYYERELVRIRKKHCRQAKAVFSWIAFARRPLKYHEVVDGVVLGQDPSGLHRETKLFRNALAHYKPLIEINTAGDVSFVHFTVQNYLLHRCSGPFVPDLLALHDVATGCVSYMKSSLNLVDPGSREKQLMRDIARGYHGLNRYARSHWLLHVEELCKACEKSSQVPEGRFLDQINELCTRHEEILKSKRGESVKSPDRKKRKYQFKALEKITKFCELAHPLQDYELQIGSVVRNTLGEGATMVDPTLFTEVAEAYDARTQQLLEPGIEQRLDYLEDSIEDFRRIYGSGAYPCRAIACQLRPEGFRTELERNKHELNFHPISFDCYYDSCKYNGRNGFPTRSQRDKHIAEKHEREDQSVDESSGKRKAPPQPLAQIEFNPGEFPDVDGFAELLNGNTAGGNIGAGVTSQEATSVDRGDLNYENQSAKQVVQQVQDPNDTMIDAAFSLAKEMDMGLPLSPSRSGHESETEDNGVHTKFAVGQTVYCARYYSEMRSSNEPPNCIGALCTIKKILVKEDGVCYRIGAVNAHPREVAECWLVSIANADESYTLENLRHGTDVLALYPETIRFYKATVAQDWEGKYVSRDPESVEVMFKAELTTCRVERRFVLELSRMR